MNKDWSCLSKDVLGLIFEQVVFVSSPRWVSRGCGLVNRHWHQVAKQQVAKLNRIVWPGFDAAQTACLNMEICAQMFCAFVARRQPPSAPVSLDVLRRSAALKKGVNEWLSSNPKDHDYFSDDARVQLQPDFPQVEAINRAGAFFMEKIRPELLKKAVDALPKEKENYSDEENDEEDSGSDEPIDLPKFDANVPLLTYVPKPLQLSVMAGLINQNTAYGGERDDENWPIEVCKDWIKARLKDLDALDEYEVYYPGDYWSVTREEDGIEFQGCCSTSFFNSDVTCNQGAVLLTSHAVLVLCTGDED